MSTSIRVLGFSGSLRQGSLNSALLRAAVELAPDGMEIETFDLAPLPFYNADVERQGLPEPVQRFRDLIAAADALLIATPEYNYSVTGVLKNAMDWASRPDFRTQPTAPSPLTGKPFALMGAGGQFGTIRAQFHFRQIALHNGMHALVKPELALARASDKFDPAGNLTDAQTRERVAALLVGLRDWTLRLRGG